MKLVQVVPTLPLGAEGVGTYARLLGRELARSGGLEVAYLAGDHRAETGAAPGGDEVARLAERSPESLAGALETADATAVVLHYSAYGFDRRGCPTWLAEGLARWRTRTAGRLLLVLFHEVYATGPPWRSSFWLAPRQRRIAARLSGSSDGRVTSTRLYAQMLETLDPSGGRSEVLPVFSTVGEPATVPGLGERPRRLVVFGGPGPRARVWGPYRRSLEAACRTLDIEQVLDLGPEGEGPIVPARLAGAAVRALGRRPAEEVARILLDAVAGFLAYPPDLVGKSTVFAAFSAHGVVPVCSWRRTGRPLPAELEGLGWDPGSGDAGDLQALANRARAWYLEHRLAVHAGTFRRLLGLGAEVKGR